MHGSNVIEKSTPHAKILLRPDGIVQVSGTNHIYSANDIRLLHKEIMEITGNKKALLLIIGNSYTSMDIEARQFLTTPEAASISVAEAYIIQSLAQRLLLSFIIKLTGTLVPRKFFEDAAQAIEWLKTAK